MLENNELAEIFIERKSQRQVTGNIYKARVANVEASLQAGFIDLGTPRNGFLHVSDCLPLGARCFDERPQPETRSPPHAALVPVPRSGPAQVPLPEGEIPVAAAPAAEPVQTVPGLSTELPAQTAVASDGTAQPARKGRRRRRGGRGRSGRARAPQQGANMVVTPANEIPSDETPAAGSFQGPEESVNDGGEDQDDQAPLTEPRELPDELLEEALDLPLQAGTEAEEAAVPGPGNEAPTSSLVSTANGNVVRVPAQAHNDHGRSIGLPPHDPRGPRDQGGVRRDNHGRAPERRHYQVHEVLRKEHEILVQVAKEGMGQKGPALTMYLSIPGRYLVLMPAISRLGVSKRIDDESQRRELKDILNGLRVPDGMGVIVRTAGMGRKREELQRDLDFLLNVWETMKKKAQEYRAPALVYEEGDVVTRVFRDVLTDDVSEIVIDDPAVLERARSYLQAISPGMESRLKLYTGHEPLFHKYNVEPQVQRLFHRKVELKSGGSIVIEQTEALVAIDVNTGRYREKKNQDDTILMTNLVAAREVARQLRLRDIGGLIMIDFIDMDNLEHRRRVEHELKMHLARDKARLNVMQISPLGIVEMTRQRVRQSLRKTFFEPCPCCGGTGHVKSIESVGLELLREINDILADRKGTHFRVTLNPDTAFEIINHFRHQWGRMEENHGARIVADGDESLPVGQWKLWVANEKGDWVLRKSSEVDDYVRNN